MRKPRIFCARSIASRCAGERFCLGAPIAHGYNGRQEGQCEKEFIVRAKHYRDQGARLRAMAEEEVDEKSRRDLLALADQYDRLSRELMRLIGIKHPNEG